MITSQFLLPYVAANVIGLALIVAAIAWPRVARGAYVVIFAGAAAVNAWMGITQPDLYVTAYGTLALLPVYRDFIKGPFAEHATGILLGIAIFQLLIAILLTQSGRALLAAVIGGVIFFAAIAPLGVGSALPATLLYGVGLVVLYRRLVRGSS